jgi:hypothetical protein
VDLDGNGTADFADRLAFNVWLKQGGSLKLALSRSVVADGYLSLVEFFSGPESALSPDAPQASLPPGGTEAASGAAAAGAPSCSTTGLLSSTFKAQQAGTFVCDAFVDDANLWVELADGQALDDTTNRLYVARSDKGANAGVTKITLGNIFQAGAIPISTSKATKIATGTAFCNTAHLAWRASDNHLFVSLETRDGADCAGVEGAVKNLTLDANGNVTNTANVFVPGTIIDGAEVEMCEGLAIIPDGICAVPARAVFGNPGELFIGEDKSPGDPLEGNSRFLKFGVFSTASCPSGAPQLFEVAEPVNPALDKLEGFAMGDFNGLGPFGVYGAVQTPREIHLLRATDPLTFTLALYANNNLTLTSPAPGGLPVDMLRPDSIAFDPFSGNLFVSEDDAPGAIWIIVPNGTNPAAQRKLVFASNFTKAGGPQGMTFPDSGVMLLSESGNNNMADSIITVIDGWRFKFNRGDANGDGAVDQADAVFIQNWLFLGGPASTCFDAADINDDTKVNLSDPIYLYNFLYQGGPAPPPPYFGLTLAHTNAACTSTVATLSTRDPTIDLLGCLEYRANCAINF